MRSEAEATSVLHLSAEEIPPDEEVKAATRMIDQIEKAVGDADARTEIASIMTQLNLHMWLNFGEAKRGCNTTRIVESELMTLGDAEAPLPKSDLDGTPPPGGGPDSGSEPESNGESPAVQGSEGQTEHGRFRNGHSGKPEASATDTVESSATARISVADASGS